jgi:hypothetical protein
MESKPLSVDKQHTNKLSSRKTRVIDDAIKQFKNQSTHRSSNFHDNRLSSIDVHPRSSRTN